MSGPLSPKSLSAHNRMESAPSMYEHLKSPTHAVNTVDDPVDKVSCVADGPPSSPFQMHIEQENHTPVQYESPLREYAFAKPLPSASKRFAVHEDILEDDSILLFSSQNTPARDTKPRSSPSKPTAAVVNLKTKVTAVAVPPDSDGNAPPPSLFEVDYSGIPRRNDDAETKYTTPTVISEDTCFSTFSAIPNADMTLFANVGNSNYGGISPRRQDLSQIRVFNATPRSSSKNLHRPASRSPSPTPRHGTSKSRDGDTTNLLLDFTQQFETFPNKMQQSPQRRGGPSPIRTNKDSNLLSYINHQRLPSPGKAHPATPGAGKRSLMNLLDFDLPPQPTPRSIPSITVRELESLKSSYLSEISSLKASLSGKEAEVGSLKKAVTDAERRVGEALETIGEERSAREHAEKEKSEWEKKGKEVENVLQSVKEEFEHAEKEREELLHKLEESNRAREDAEIRAVEAAARTEVMPNTAGEQPTEPCNLATEALVAQRVAQQLDEKMENLARELHAVYKKKHESKVATLKKTYEARSEKKCQELQQRVEELSKANEGPSAGASHNTIGASNEGVDLKEHEAEIQKHESHATRLLNQIDELRRTQGQLMHELESERAEKGDLVAAVDEMLALQVDNQASTGPGSAAIDGFRKSIAVAKPSGLRAPGGPGPESRIGKVGGPAPIFERTSSAKSRMMHNIERMGGARSNE